MYSILLLPFVISFVHSEDSIQIPNVADLPVFPGSVGNLDERYGPSRGFGSFGLAPLSNIGSGPVGNIGQNNNELINNGIGNLPIIGQQNIGQGIIGNLPITSSQNNGQGGFNENNGQGDSNLNNGQAIIGNLPITGSQNNAQGGIANLIITDSQNNGQGSIGNFPITDSQNNGQNGIGNLPILGSQNNGLADGLLDGLGNLLNINQTNNRLGIERPCQVFDIYCIRRYFKKNSRCKEVRGPVPEPYFRAQSSLQITRINATFSAFNVLYEGLNGRIVEFYINRNTDKLVISVEFRNVTFFSRDVYYRFYRRGREPITTYDYLYLNYKSYITTTIIPKIRDLQLYKSETNTFTNDAIPAFSIGPNAFSYPDSTVQLSRIELLKNLPIVVREAQLTEGPFSAATFIQNSICDFKLKVL